MEDAAKIGDADQNLSLRLQHALTADKDELFPMLQGQPVEVLLALLRNPAFDEHHLLELLKQRALAVVGETVIMLGGQSHTAGATNMLRVHTIG